MINNYDEFLAAYSRCAKRIGISAPTAQQVLDVLPTELAEDINVWGWDDAVVQENLFKFMWTLQ
ncbi:hypothetical protein SEA1_gp0076 [Salmonella phage SEA1]|nr:hypothetical protein SEA1_gp0076 [Salmonella phage SEA1]